MSKDSDKEKDKSEKSNETYIKAKIPDGRYKAKWLSTGKESDEFKVENGQYVLFKKNYQLTCINDKVKFGWGDTYGTIQELEETKIDGNILWKVLNNANHRQILWLN